MRAECPYTKRSSARATLRAAGLPSAPIWIGASGQRSRTSNTSGARQRAAAARAGSAIVSGGEVAYTTSGRGPRRPAAAAPSAKRAKASMRRG